MADNIISVKPHRKLILWQKSIAFCLEVYKLTEQFPKNETYGLTSQLKRAVTSISLNIAEGAGRNYTKEFIQFLGIVNGSIAETDTLLELALQLNFLSITDFEKLQNMLNEISALNNGLIKKLKSQ